MKSIKKFRDRLCLKGKDKFWNASISFFIKPVIPNLFVQIPCLYVKNV